VTPQTVTKWRKALGVGPVTAGTKRLKREHAGPPASLRLWALARPEDAAGRLPLMFVPFSVELMESWPLGKLVNSPENNVLACTEPAA
jgi:hypothetical protein